MEYELEFFGNVFYDGFTHEVKLMPENGVYEFVGHGLGKGSNKSWHFTKDTFENRFSIERKYFKIVRRIEK